MLLETNKTHQAYKSDQIAQILPHASPFLFLHSAIISESEATGSFAITHNLDCLRGHFKNNPVFPASLMTEALGQLGVLFLLQTQSPSLILPVDPGKIMFVSSDRISCHRICRPGDTLNLSIKPKTLRHPIFKFDGKIQVNDQKVASAENISLAFDYQNIS